MGDDPDKWYLSRLDDLCRGEKFEQSCDLELKGRVVFTCLNFFSQTHFATAVGHISIQLSTVGRSQ